MRHPELHTDHDFREVTSAHKVQQQLPPGQKVEFYLSLYHRTTQKQILNFPGLS
jgi:hypothetical protein